MSTVQRVRVGDVLRLDRTPIEPDPLSEYVSIGVRSFGRGIFHYDAVPGDKLGKLRFFAMSPGKLVVSNIKGWEGAIALSDEGDLGTIASNRFLIYDAIDGAIDTSWARWFFLSEPGIELIQRASPGSADRNRTLAVKRFENLVISLPTISEQRRVATRLTRIAQVGSRIEASLQETEELSRALQVGLASGTQRSQAKWPPTELADVLAPVNATIPVTPDGEYRIAGIYSFGKGLIDRGTISGADTSYATLTRLRAGNVVISKLNGWEGAVAVVDELFDGAHVSGEYPAFVVDESRLLPGFFRGIARSPAFWDTLNQSVRGSMVRRRRISARDFLRATILLPPIEEQSRISAGIDILDRVLEKSQKSSDRAKALSQAALNSVFG